MNDPRETKGWYSATADAPLIDRMLRRSTCIASFTVDIPAEREDLASNHHHGWARARMWDQYASADRRHDGACLVISFQHLTGYVDNLFNTEPVNPSVLTEPVDGLLGDGNLMFSDYVRYSNLPPSPLRLPAYRNEAELEEILRHRHDLVREWYMTKNRDWQSEHEYRIVIRRWGVADDQLDKGICFHLGNYLRGIILGEDFDAKEESEIYNDLDRASLPDIELFRCVWDAGQPDLIPVPRPA